MPDLFGDEGKGDRLFSVAQLAEEAERELAMRRRLYPAFVMKGRVRQSEADDRIAKMEAIAKWLRAQVPP